MTEFFSGYYLIHPGSLDPDAAQRAPRIIISMTSFTPRLGKLYLAVNSIFNQSLKPDKVILYLGDDVDKNALPKTLNDLTARGVELRFVNNLRSHKKHFYAMQMVCRRFTGTGRKRASYHIRNTEDCADPRQFK